MRKRAGIEPRDERVIVGADVVSNTEGHIRGAEGVLSQNCIFEARLENPMSKNQWFASLNFPVFGNLRQNQ